LKTSELVEKLRQAMRPEGPSVLLDELISLFPDSPLEIPREHALPLYLKIKVRLQLMGCKLSLGNEQHDAELWRELTEVLACVRGVFTEAYGIELPEARVVSPVMEMVEAGMFVATRGEDGETYVAPNEQDPYIMTIKVTEIPSGPAPQRFRELWVGMEFPARQGVPGFDVSSTEPARDHYVVPKARALALMRARSEEAGEWFEENFVGNEFLFGTDEAVVV
jgi:hypothetical protein